MNETVKRSVEMLEGSLAGERQRVEEFFDVTLLEYSRKQEFLNLAKVLLGSVEKIGMFAENKTAFECLEKAVAGFIAAEARTRGASRGLHSVAS